MPVRKALLLTLLFATLSAAVEAQISTNAESTLETANETTIERLIQRLGAETFRERESAAQSLREIGIRAYPTLTRFRDSQDSEIRQRVRSLIGKLLPQLLRQDISPIELSIISDYLLLDVPNREQRIQTVGLSLSPEYGVEAMLRVLQLENDPTLSKAAAASIFAGGFSQDAAARERVAEFVDNMDLDATDASIRQWIQEYASSLAKPGASIDAFIQFAEEEQALYRRDVFSTDEQTIILPLKLYALALMVESDSERAEAYAVELFDDTRRLPMMRELFVNLLFRRSAAGAVNLDRDAKVDNDYDKLLVAIANANEQWFQNNRLYKYLWAAAAKNVQKEKTATKLTEEAYENVTDESDRLTVALQLRFLGLDEWCEREHRALIGEKDDPPTQDSIQSTSRLADILHQQGRHKEAVELMKQLVERCNESKGPDKELFDEVLADDFFNAHLHFYEAMAARKRGDEEEAIEHFRSSFELFTGNSDIFCEAYKITDTQWRIDLSEFVDATTEQLEQQIDVLRKRYSLRPQQRYRDDIASKSNELAWILVNTGGNLSDALNYARVSVEHEPVQSHSIDTLATCHFKLKQFDKAIEYERMAVKLAPHREDIMATLRRFEDGKAAAK